mmetsp:Transcript_2632/g.6637  ORF Transcript_2632/g.6637 Transcript_2632/m.6637 type:complete len:204 (-) Transcript_2632:719-1330(-)
MMKLKTKKLKDCTIRPSKDGRWKQFFDDSVRPPCAMSGWQVWRRVLTLVLAKPGVVAVPFCPTWCMPPGLGCNSRNSIWPSCLEPADFKPLSMAAPPTTRPPTVRFLVSAKSDVVRWMGPPAGRLSRCGREVFFFWGALLGTLAKTRTATSTSNADKVTGQKCGCSASASKSGRKYVTNAERMCETFFTSTEHRFTSKPAIHP